MRCKVCNKAQVKSRGMCNKCYMSDLYKRLPEVRIIDGFKFDRNTKLLYDKDVHFNQSKRWTEEELEYVCKFSGYDSLRSLSFALGRTERTISSKVSRLRRDGLFEFYRERYMQRLEEEAKNESK